MQPTRDNTTTLDGYMAMLAPLSPADKLDLIARLTASVKGDTGKRKSRFSGTRILEKMMEEGQYSDNIKHEKRSKYSWVIKNYDITKSIKSEKFDVALADGKTIDQIPQALNFLQSAIDDSRFILDLPDNWDNSGSEAYTVVVWNSAIVFLINYAKRIWTTHKRRISAPQIFPGPKGSIDILWDNETYRALVNISKDSQKGTFFVDKFGNQSIEGTFIPDNFDIDMLPIFD